MNTANKINSAIALKASLSTAASLVVFFVACVAAYATEGNTFIGFIAVITAWVAPVIAIASLATTVNNLLKLNRA